MSNPQEIKKAILATLAEKGDYKTILENLDDDDEARDSVLAVLAEKGDYTSVLKGLNNSNKKKQTQEAFEKLSPLFEFSEMITKEAKGAFMGDLSKQLDASSGKKFEELTQSVQEAKNTLQNELQSLLSTTKSELVAEHLSRYQEAETALSSKLMQLAVDVVSAKANELLPLLAQGAKLTEEEIDDIIDASALSVESQMAGIVGEYIAEHKFSVTQIEGFAEAVRQLLPKDRQITWNEIANKPDISQGGTNANLVRQMIDAALANFTGGSGVPNGGTTGQVLTKLSIADGDTDWQDPTSGGVTDHGALTGLADDDHTQYHTDARGDARYSQLGHTHTASQVTDFSTASDARIAAASSVSIASLSGGKVPTSQLPALALTDVFTVASQIAQLALTAEEGDVAIRTDQNKSYIHNGGVTGTMADWSELLTPTDAVLSVNGETGAVTLTTDDISDTGQTNKWATAGEKTKLGHISVTQAVDLDTLESDTVTNNAKVTNATHTGDATGSTALTLATVNSNVGSFGLAASVAQFTVNAKGLITAAANVAIAITASAVTDFAAIVRATVLTGLSVATSTAVTAADSILVAIGKLQAQNTAQDTAIALNTAKVTNATHTGDATGATALTVVRINGTSLAGLGTGLLKNTTGTGVPSIAINSDLPTMTATIGGAVPTPPNNTTTFLRGDGTFAAPSSGFADPLTTNGDIIARVSGSTTRLAQGTNGQFLGVSGGALGYYTPAGGGGSTTVDVAQTGHGLSAGNLIRSNGTNGQYAQADKDVASQADAVGYVTAVADANNFTYQPLGHYITNNVPAQAAGTALYVGDSGALTATRPVSIGQIQKPVAIVVHNATAMVMFNMRGMEVTSDSAGVSDAVSGSITLPTGIRNRGVYEHTETISVPGVTAGQIVEVFVATHLDTDENSEIDLGVTSLTAVSTTDAIIVTIQLKEPNTGIIKINYKINP